MAKRKEFTHCLTEKVTTYALGRGLEYADRCVVDKVAASLASNQYRFTHLIVQVTQSEPFLKRKDPGAGAKP